MSILFKNGLIVNSESRSIGHVLVNNKKIEKVFVSLDEISEAQQQSIVETIDVKGNFIIPGGVDPHVHAYLPLSTGNSVDTFATASKAALLGGTTTIMDFVWKQSEDNYLQALHRWQAQSVGISYCDYSFHAVVTNWCIDVQNEVIELISHGIQSLKIYLAYKGSVGISDEDLWKTLDFAAKHKLVVLAHCEDAEAIALKQADLIDAEKCTAKYHHDSRPPVIEALGVKKVLTYAELTGATVYIVHVSSADAVSEIIQAKKRGVRVFAETLMPFLLLDKSLTDQVNQEEACKFILSPPLRSKSHQDILWKALLDGTIDTIASDHAPFNYQGQKRPQHQNFTKIPNGLPTVEDRISLLYNFVHLGQLTMEKFVELTSTKAAQIFNLYPRKGVIQSGSDADLIVFNPNVKRVISSSNHHMNVDYNPFEGFEVNGQPQHVMLGGTFQVKDYKWIGDAFGAEILRDL